MKQQMLGTRTILIVLMKVGVLLCLTLGPGLAEAQAETNLIKLHAELPDTLSTAELTKFGLFSEIPQLNKVWFETTPWGGIKAQIDVSGPGEITHLERSISRASWRYMHADVQAILAGSGQPAPADTCISESESIIALPDSHTLSWPEIPLPEGITHSPNRAKNAPPVYPSIKGHWLFKIGAGYRRNMSSYKAFFTDQGAFNVSFCRPVSESILPFLTLDAGFGDLQDNFEAIAGDGRGNTFGMSAGVLAKHSVGRRTSIYASSAYGYFIRSMTWNSSYNNEGNLVNAYSRELRNTGVSLRLGLLVQKSHPTKPRFFDIGLGLLVCPAEGLDYYSGDQRFVGKDQDVWFTISIRFWDKI